MSACDACEKYVWLSFEKHRLDRSGQKFAYGMIVENLWHFSSN